MINMIKPAVRILFYLLLCNMVFSNVTLAAAQTLNIMSFNIRYGTADDGNNHWKFRKDQLIELLDSEKADLIGLQEVLKFQLDEITAALPDYAMIGVSRMGNWQDEFSAILYRKDKFIPRKTNTYWLSDTPEKPSNGWGNDILRIVTWAEFKQIDNDRSFYFYNAHFDHRSQISRKKGAEQLINIINQRDHAFPVIITGDFNAGETNPAITTITSNGYSDSFRLIHPDERAVGTFNSFRGERDGDKIDYVFVGPGVEVLSAAINRHNINGKYPSDHYPVTTIIKLID